jgi:prepilin-type N-terminal cleavage/methylation domain-containing protein
MGVNRRGLTLIELLVTIALAGLVLTLFVWFLVTTSQLTEQGTARVELQQSAILSALKMERDLRRSAKEAITLFPSPPVSSDPRVVAMVPIADIDSSGQKIWEQEVIAYHWTSSSKELHRREWPPKVSPGAFSTDPLPTNSPTRLDDGDMQALATEQGQRLAYGVEDFVAKWVGDAVSIRVVVERDVSGKQAPLRFEFEKVVALRH